MRRRDEKKLWEFQDWLFADQEILDLNPTTQAVLIPLLSICCDTKLKDFAVPSAHVSYRSCICPICFLVHIRRVGRIESNGHG